MRKRIFTSSLADEFRPIRKHLPGKVAFKAPTDFEDPAFWDSEEWDLVHMGQLCGSIQDWYILYERIFTYVPPVPMH